MGCQRTLTMLTRIFLRTEKGLAELAHRSKDIPARARTLLLLVDGHTTGGELLAKVGFENREELFELLLTQGYIEAEPEPEPVPEPEPEAPAAPESTAGEVHSVAPQPGEIDFTGVSLSIPSLPHFEPEPEPQAPPPPDPLELIEARRVMLESVEDVLGPDAGLLSGKIAATRNLVEMRRLAEKYRTVLVEAGRKRRALAFWEQIEPLLLRD